MPTTEPTSDVEAVPGVPDDALPAVSPEASTPVPAALPAARASRGRTPFPAWAVAAALIPPGWLFVLAVNRWHLTTPSVMMMLCWTMLVLTGYWVMQMAVASVTEGDGDWFRARGRRDDLEREKKSLLKAIKEIEFDRDTAKMSNADAAELIAGYRAKAIDVIKAIEALDNPVGPDGGAPLSARDRVLSELRARAAVDAKPGKGKAQAKAAAKPSTDSGNERPS